MSAPVECPACGCGDERFRVQEGRPVTPRPFSAQWMLECHACGAVGIHDEQYGRVETCWAPNIIVVQEVDD